MTDYEVWTANEDGWTDYHEETEITDDFEIALTWLGASDVVRGEIRSLDNGDVIAWKDWNDEKIEYLEGYEYNSHTGLVHKEPLYAIYTDKGEIDTDPEPMVFKTELEASQVLIDLIKNGVVPNSYFIGTYYGVIE